MASNKAGTKTKETLSNLKGDYCNIAFLLLLYVLQGVPIGLSSAVPLLLQNRKVSYSEQALFSFVTWPFSLKLLWAPIVDSVFWRKLGRRKSWLIPVQLALGLFMLVLATSIESLLTDDPVTGNKPNIQLLTFIFLMLNFLAATQDIAVDGWALTMLKRRNVGYASTCNTAGQTAGFFIGNVIFLALESADFCNKYIRAPDEQLDVGIITFQSFLHNCGWVFIVVTIIIAILKRETDQRGEIRTEQSDHDPEVSTRLTRRKSSEDNSDEQTIEKDLSVRETYTLLLKIIKLPSFRLFAAILLTCKLGFSAPDAVSGLKLVEAGVHKENLALLAVPMVPLQVILPWVISRITCGPRPLDLFVKAYPYRLLFGAVFPLIVYWTPMLKLEDGTFPSYYYIMLIIVYALHQVTVYSMFVALMGFHASVSDPTIGGSYMTLLNTITNLGGNWPSTTALWLVDKLTVQNCVEKCKNHEKLFNTTVNVSEQITRPTIESKPICQTDCETLFDGYYLECAICVIVGFVWLQWGAKRLKRIQSLPPAAWFVSINKGNK